MELEHYRDKAAFEQKILALTNKAVAGLDDKPKLIAFPETIGFPLLLTLGDYEAVAGFSSVAQAGLYLAKRYWRELLPLVLKRRAWGLEALYLLRAVPAYQAYCEAFAEAAAKAEATIVAGSIFLPKVEEEAARGVHSVGHKVYNTTFSFSPHGRILDRSRKNYLTPGLESHVGLSHGSLSQVHSFETPLGRIGVAVCLDGFYSSVIERLDGLGAQIVVQPSANEVSWQRPWPPNPSLREGEAWLTLGLRAQIQNRLHIRYGVNPMMVGEVFNLKPRGRSSIVVNRRFDATAQVEGYEGILRLAASDDQEEIVRAEVVL